MKELISFEEQVQDVVLPIFQNGTFWLHSENVLLAALADDRQNVRNQAINQILKIRNDERIKKLANDEQLRLKKG